MREASKDPKRLKDILEAIDNVFQYVGNDDIRNTHPITPWRQITGMRNFLIHGYHQVEKDLVWEVIDKDLHILRPQIVDYIDELTSQEVK